MVNKFKFIFLFCLSIAVLSCAAKQRAVTITDKSIQNEIIVFLTENFRIGKWQSGGALTGEIDRVFSEVLNGRNNNWPGYRNLLDALTMEYNLNWEDGAADSIDYRLMLISEIFLDLIHSMLEPDNRTEIMKKINERIDAEFPPIYDLGFINYKIMIDLFDIATFPYNHDEINNKVLALHKFIHNTGSQYDIDNEILEFVNTLKIANMALLY
jgi:hypothetical protein